MTYFLDFDRTVFDFDAFFSDLINQPELASVRERALQVVQIPRGIDSTHDEMRNRMWEDLHSLYSTGVFSFAPGSLSRFVFPDARVFLEQNGRNTILVTKGGLDLSFQKGKVESSGVSELVCRSEYVTRDAPKGASVKALLGEYPGPHIFVDDYAKELDSVAEECPSVTLFEIRRDGKPGSGEYAVIRSLKELP